VGFAAINTGNNLLYLVLGMMLSIIVVSGILSELALKGLEVARSLPTEVHAGSPYLTGIAVHNTKSRLASFSVQVEDVIDGHTLAKKCYFLKLPPRARQNTSYRSEFKRRGRYAYRGFHLSTRFPFAFFVKTFYVASEEELLVLPRIHPVSPNLEEPRGVAGLKARTQRGLGRDFHGLRPHREGDDARDIHWKRSARDGRLVTREYESETGRRLGLCLNLRTLATPGAPDEGHLDRVVDLAASLLVHLQRRGFSIDLQAGELKLEIAADGRGLFAALRALAIVQFTAEPQGADAPPQPFPGARGGRWLLVQADTGSAPMDTRGFTEILTPGASPADATERPAA
jgi:uncharacterized protein (DUF58 family)